MILCAEFAVKTRHLAGFQRCLLAPGMFFFPVIMSQVFTEHFLCARNCDRQWELGEKW